jgi:hypothetical protein
MIKLTQDGHDIYLFGDWDDTTEKRGNPTLPEEKDKVREREREILVSVIQSGKLPFRTSPADGIDVLRKEIIAQARFRNRTVETLRKLRDQLWTRGQEMRSSAPIAGDLGTAYASGNCEGLHIGIMICSQGISDILDALALKGE